MSRIFLKSPAAVWTGLPEVDEKQGACGGIVIEAGRIVEHVAAGAAPTLPVDEEFDCRDRVLIPGLINCHHHFYQTLTRALPAALNKELFEWLVNLYPVWAGLDEDCIRLSTKLALAELMLSGCTTASDHHYLFNREVTAAIDIQVAAAQEMGMRVVLTRGSMSLGTSSGGLPPDCVVQDEAAILEESERLIKAYHDAGDGAMTQIALAPCSPFSVTPELMQASADLATQYGVLLHTHLAETQDENQFCLDRFGQRPLDYLESVGWLRPGVWLAHGIHFNDEEVERLGKHRVGVSHCPSSNMMLASGMSRVLELEALGAPVGLGVDGSASNDCSNMMEEVRQAFLLQRLQYGSARVTHHDALRWGTSGGAGVLGRPELGRLHLGAQADLALFRLDELRFSGSHDAIAALVLCGAHRVSDLMVAGQWRVRDGNIPGLDLAQLRAEHSDAARRLALRASA